MNKLLRYRVTAQLTIKLVPRDKKLVSYLLPEGSMTLEQLRTLRLAAMNRGDYYAVNLCNRALRQMQDLHDLVTEIAAREDLRERVLRGEA